MSQHNTGFTDQNREQKSSTIKGNMISQAIKVVLKSLALEIWLLQNQTDVMIHKLIAL